MLVSTKALPSVEILCILYYLFNDCMICSVSSMRLCGNADAQNYHSLGR